MPPSLSLLSRFSPPPKASCRVSLHHHYPFINSMISSPRSLSVSASIPAVDSLDSPPVEAEAVPNPPIGNGRTRRWRPMCLYHTHGKCTRLNDAFHVERFNHDIASDLCVDGFVESRLVPQNLDYLLVLDLEGKVEILEFPVVMIDARTMSFAGSFHRFVRPVRMSEKRINEYVEGKYGRMGVDGVWHDTAITFKEMLREFEMQLRANRKQPPPSPPPPPPQRPSSSHRPRKKRKRLDSIGDDPQRHHPIVAEGPDTPGSVRRSSRPRRAPVILDASPTPSRKRRRGAGRVGRPPNEGNKRETRRGRPKRVLFGGDVDGGREEWTSRLRSRVKGVGDESDGDQKGERLEMEEVMSGNSESMGDESGEEPSESEDQTLQEWLSPSKSADGGDVQVVEEEKVEVGVVEEQMPNEDLESKSEHVEEEQKMPGVLESENHDIEEEQRPMEDVDGKSGPDDLVLPNEFGNDEAKVEVEPKPTLKDEVERPRGREGRRCGLCGGGTDGKPPKRLVRDFNDSNDEGYDGSSASEEPNYDVLDGFGDEPGWLGRLLGPILDRFGIARVWVHQHCAVWSPEPCARAEGCTFDHRKFLIVCTDHRHLFQPQGSLYLQRIKKLKVKKMRLDIRKTSADASRKDLEAEEKWLENCGEDEEFLKREGKRLHRDILRISPVYIGGSSGNENLYEGWESVAGLQDVVQCMKEVVILPLLYPEFYSSMGITPPRGVLLHGYPGTGKTLVVRALIGACSRGDKKIAYFARKGADCLGKYVGDAERQLRLLFHVAEKSQPAIIFFDEIDGLAPCRSRQQDQTHCSVVSTLLALLDGVKSRGSVIVIGATNRPDAVDPALRRPGRFDREIYFPLPSVMDRSAILSLHTRSWPKPISEPVLSWVAKQTVGFAGADLQALCTQAAIIALKRNCSLKGLMSSAEKSFIHDQSDGEGKNDDWKSVLFQLNSSGARLKEGPSADIHGPWKGWPFNSCIVRPPSSSDKVAMGSYPGNEKNKENFSIVRGLIAVGLLAYRGLYSSVLEVSREVRNVLELLLGEINSKILGGKDKYRFIRLLSQVAYLEDMVNSWAYSFQRSQLDNQMPASIVRPMPGVTMNTQDHESNTNLDACLPHVSNKSSQEENSTCINSSKDLANDGLPSSDMIDAVPRPSQDKLSLTTDTDSCQNSFSVFRSVAHGDTLNEPKKTGCCEPCQSENHEPCELVYQRSQTVKQDNVSAEADGVSHSEEDMGIMDDCISRKDRRQCNGLSRTGTVLSSDVGGCIHAETVRDDVSNIRENNSVPAMPACICVYECCSGCCHAIHTLIRKVLSDSLESYGYLTIDDVHDVVASCSVSLSAKIQKYFFTRNSSCDDRSSNQQQNGIDAKLCACQDVGNQLKKMPHQCGNVKNMENLPATCGNHRIGQEDAASTDVHKSSPLGPGLKFFFRDGTLVPPHSINNIGLHCNVENLCICALTERITKNQKDFSLKL
ncbi:ATPase family AAA domain-containing protein [Acorus calamus]|uniref:ATPase family AAA domain-containing protein n=1 Tax=Acorus calamus TaxID=4465 RepID=A0AAV9F7X7_ACOCL|nr:ATPase family AAA domain-containing protein [Acorus calamus]